MKILLASVFGPYAVDDAFGRKENRMELFHNQVTREQGIFSIRMNHQSFGLHFIAENINAPAIVLDFPTEDRFKSEIRKGYDYVGISFITPNFAKARRMAELVRIHAPESRIILGGHGTAIPGIEGLIDCDFVCRGEGVRWFRSLLGEDPCRPFRHPVLRSGFNKRVFGVPMRTEAAVLIPGVGCPNGCRFCSTSHFFDRAYTAYFDTGRELFDICRTVERRTGMKDFFVMDENFLKRPERARELLRLMEENGVLYNFAVFSSAEAITALGPEFLARLGIYFVWIGVESAKEIYEKNRNVDMKALVRGLRDHGISVLASGILFLEHHDAKTIWEDIRFMVDLESDMVQFMQFGPMPATALYMDYEARGILRPDIPFEEWHGQHRIWFDHPDFTGEESEKVLRAAFRHDFDVQGPSVLRMCDTMLRGYRTLSSSRDPVLRKRAETFRRWASDYRPALGVMRKFAHNDRVREIAERTIAAYRDAFGPPTAGQRIKGFIAGFLAGREAARVAEGRNVYQPRTISTAFRTPGRDLAAGMMEQVTSAPAVSRPRP